MPKVPVAAVPSEFEGESFSHVQVPYRGRALFSSTEAAVFVVGGDEEDQGTGLIRVYDVSEGRWSGALTTDAALAPRREILGAGYDAVGSTLYVLDLSADMARLVGHQIDGEQVTSRLLTEIPFAGTSVSYGLAVAEDGAVVLVAGGETGYSAWRIREVSPGMLDVRQHTGQGIVADDPKMGNRGLVLPVITETTVELRRLSPDTFVVGALPASL